LGEVVIRPLYQEKFFGLSEIFVGKSGSLIIKRVVQRSRTLRYTMARIPGTVGKAAIFRIEAAMKTQVEADQKVFIEQETVELALPTQRFCCSVLGQARLDLNQRPPETHA
jgi:hypothetical protein